MNKRHAKQIEKTVEIEITKAGTHTRQRLLSCIPIVCVLELEEKNFKVNLTIIDTPGFGDYVNNYNSWMPVYEFLDDQHESFMAQEQQPIRQGVIDLRVHACLYFVRPNGHG
jgi:cell division control protein 12